MKWICVLAILLQGVLCGMEVRSYQVGKEVFVARYHWDHSRESEIDPFMEPSEVPEGPGKVLRKSPFESRFLEGVKSLWDCSEEMGQLLGKEKWAGIAVIDVEGGQLVVKAEAREHFAIAAIFEEGLGSQVETKVAIYRVPGVKLGRDARKVEEVEKGELVAGVSCVHLLGQAFEAEAGGFKITGEVQTDHDFEIVDNRVVWKSEIEGAEFQLKTAFVALRGIPFAVELGSSDGEGSLVAVMEQERVLHNGVKFDEWILKEDGGAFLREERLKGGEPAVPPEIDGVRRFVVPPTFLTFIAPSQVDVEGEDDPFSVEENPRSAGRKIGLVYQGDDPELAIFPKDRLYDVKILLQKNGVDLTEEDFAVFYDRTSTLLVKTSKLSEELIEGIVHAGISHPPRMIRLDFSRLESEEEVTSKMEGLEVKEKVGLVVLPGQNGSVQLGGRLFGEVEAQIDGNDALIDLRGLLSRKENFTEPLFKTGLVLRDGLSVVIQQGRVEEKWQAWVVTAELISVGE